MEITGILQGNIGQCWGNYKEFMGQLWGDYMANMGHYGVLRGIYGVIKRQLGAIAGHL